jgi:O-antigen/teichoic acid export membrane protein
LSTEPKAGTPLPAPQPWQAVRGALRLPEHLKTSEKLRRVIGNFSWLAVGQALQRLSLFALVVVLAHRLTTAEYALTTVLLVYSTMWAPIFNFGLGIIGVREMAQSRIAHRDFISLVLPLKLLTGAVCLLLMIGIGAVIGYADDSFVPLALIALATVVISQAEFFHLPFTAVERMSMTAKLTAAERIIVALGGVSGVLITRSIRGFAIGYAFGSVLSVVFAYVVYVREFGRPRLGINGPLLWWYTKESLPVATTWLLSIAYGRAGVFVLERVASADEVAQFNTAFFVLISLQMAVTVLMQASFPAISMASTAGSDGFRRRIAAMLPTALAVSVLLAPCAGVASTWLVPLLFGTKFTEAGVILRILFWIVPLFSANAVLTVYLQASHRQGTAAFALVWGTLVSIGASIPLAIWAGAKGTAAAMFAAEFSVLVAMHVLLLRKRDLTIDAGRIGTVLASAAAAIVGVAANLLDLSPLVPFMAGCLPLVFLIRARRPAAEGKSRA